jgi:hypothetical protein
LIVTKIFCAYLPHFFYIGPKLATTWIHDYTG